uniref:Uncharacterized protein n=1 Tax=Strongyloides papillosus TaxID=174720 RepID=A0A0N5C7U1_STREA
MILKNIIIILFIILFNIIDVENHLCKRRRPKLRVWGRIDCRNRLAKDMRIGLYQFNRFKYPKLLKEVPCRCEKYFDIRAEEISHSRTMPYLAVTYKYINGRFLCKPRAIVRLPKSYDNSPYKCVKIPIKIMLNKHKLGFHE